MKCHIEGQLKDKTQGTTVIVCPVGVNLYASDNFVKAKADAEGHFALDVEADKMCLYTAFLEEQYQHGSWRFGNFLVEDKATVKLLFDDNTWKVIAGGREQMLKVKMDAEAEKLYLGRMEEISNQAKKEILPIVEELQKQGKNPEEDSLLMARNKVYEDEYKKAASGKELLARRLKNWKLTLKDELLHDIMKKLKYPTVNSFYAAVGDETIDVNAIKTYLLDHIKQQQNTENTTEITHDAWTGEREQAGSDDILVLNAKDLKGLDYKMAKCCHPVYGDNVFGFVTRTEGIKIHRMSCPNASRLMAAYPYRIQKVRWADTPSSGNFQASLRITSGMETQVINQIMDIVGSFKASVRSFSVSENARNSTYDITLKIAVPSHLELDKVISQIRLLKNVIKINRS